jgi:hypothetical protein
MKNRRVSAKKPEHKILGDEAEKLVIIREYRKISLRIYESKSS